MAASLIAHVLIVRHGGIALRVTSAGGSFVQYTPADVLVAAVVAAVCLGVPFPLSACALLVRNSRSVIGRYGR